MSVTRPSISRYSQKGKTMDPHELFTSIANVLPILQTKLNTLRDYHSRSEELAVSTLSTNRNDLILHS